MDLKLQGQRVLVTGGSRGIGLAIAQAFAAEGAMPIIASRDAEQLALAVKAIHSSTGITAESVPADLSQPGATEALFKAVGEVDVLVNNAGSIPGGSLHDLDEQRWRQAWELKLFSYINLTRAYLPMMEQRGRGVICNIIGLAGVAPRYDYICGSTANAGLMAFTQGLGGGSVRKGVRVFGINPAPTRSQRMQTMLERQATNKWGDASRWMELSTKLPFGRMAEPDEIARMTVFACSPLSGYLSGTVINLDAGQIYAETV